jgi:hypothetical protein
MALSVTTIETAINTIMTTGQSVTVAGMSYSAANLSDLESLLTKAQNESMRSGGTRPLFRGINLSGAGY